MKYVGASRPWLKPNIWPHGVPKSVGYPERPDLKRILKAIDKYKPDVFPSITTLNVSLLEHPEIKKYDLSPLEVTTFAAMGVPPHVVEKWGKLTGGTRSKDMG